MAHRNLIAGLVLSGVVLLAVIAAAGCITAEDSETADTLFLGNVITMDEKNPFAEAVAVKDGKILFVGSAADAERYCSENTEIIDYDRNTIYPGFLEAHMHVGYAGMRNYGMIPLTSGVSLEETLKEFQKYVQEHPGQPNYVGTGWLYNGIDQPTAAMIDALVSDVPVILQTGDGHAAWVNTKELELMNLDPETIKQAGEQQIHVDANGNPTGFLQEAPAIALGKEFPFTVEQLKEFLLKWQDNMFENGYTAVSDTGMELVGDKIYQAISELDKEGKLKIRIYGLSVVNDNTDTPEEDMAHIAALAKKYNSENFKIIGAKIFLDGVTESHTSWLLNPYNDTPDSVGVKRFSDIDKMADLITAASKLNLIVHAHTMGDGAVHAFAEAVEQSVQVTGNYNQRNAAAHLQFVSDEDKERFAKYGIVAVAGYHWAIRGANSANEEKLIGPERFSLSYPGQSLIDAGITVAAHSDYPISPVMSAPLILYLGSTRLLPFSEDTDIIGPQERMSREDILKTMTSNVAYMWKEEDRMGTLEAGKLANMAVLSVDLLHDDLDIIAYSLEHSNVATIVDGKVVYEAEPEELTEAEIEDLINLLSTLYDEWSAAESLL